MGPLGLFVSAKEGQCEGLYTVERAILIGSTFFCADIKILYYTGNSVGVRDGDNKFIVYENFKVCYVPVTSRITHGGGGV